MGCSCPCARGCCRAGSGGRSPARSPRSDVAGPGGWAGRSTGSRSDARPRRARSRVRSGRPRGAYRSCRCPRRSSCRADARDAASPIRPRCSSSVIVEASPVVPATTKPSEPLRARWAISATNASSFTRPSASNGVTIAVRMAPRSNSGMASSISRRAQSLGLSGGRAHARRRVGRTVSAVDRVRQRQRSQKRAHPR